MTVVIDDLLTGATVTTNAVAAVTSAGITVQSRDFTVTAWRPFRGVVADFTDDGPAAPASAYQAIIKWGKGSVSAGRIIGANGQYTVIARHVFPKFTGTKTVTITVTDPEGESETVTDSVTEFVRHPNVIRLRQTKVAARPHR